MNKYICLILNETGKKKKAKATVMYILYIKEASSLLSSEGKKRPVGNTNVTRSKAIK